jgi:hypothetical protein
MKRIISVEDCQGDNTGAQAGEDLRKLIYADAYDLISKFELSNKEKTYGNRLAKIISDEIHVSKSESLISNFLLDTFGMTPSELGKRQYRRPADPLLEPKYTLSKYTPAADAATKSFEDLFRKPSKKARKKASGESSFPVSTAFGAQILLDINESLEENVSHGYEKLRSLGAMAENTLGIGWDDSDFPNKEYTRQHITVDREELTSRWPFPGGA